MKTLHTALDHCHGGSRAPCHMWQQSATLIQPEIRWLRVRAPQIMHTPSHLYALFLWEEHSQQP